MNGPPGQPMPVMMPMPYVMAAGQPQYQPQPQGNRLRKGKYTPKSAAIRFF